MAKRKAAGTPRRARGTTPKRNQKKTATRKAAARRKKAAARKAPARRKKPAARKAPARRKKPAARKAPARRKKPAARKAPARRKKPAARKAPAARGKPATRKAPATRGPSASEKKKAAKAPATARKVPRLDRARWTVRDDDTLGPPQVAGADRPDPPAHVPYDRFAEHGGTGPSIAAGDLDADWESAANVGDEAPGGDNPTPDQDRVDEIGHAIGVEFADEEVLDVEGKVGDRDRHRWERDPKSSEDFDER